MENGNHQRALFRTSEERDESFVLTEEAIARADANALKKWKQFAIWAVERAARQHTEFTADDVWWILKVAKVKPPRQPSAMGPVLREGKIRGFCISTNRTRESRRPAAHRRPLRVWESSFFV
jgi:hypothetical protein